MAGRLPAANLVLLKRLLSLLQQIGQHAASSRMSVISLAIRVGPNLLSPPNEELLPLEAMLEVTEKVRFLEAGRLQPDGDQSWAVERSLAAPSLQQTLVGWLPGRAAPQRQPAAWKQGSGVGEAACLPLC